MKSPLATAVTGALFNRWGDGWRLAGVHSRSETVGGEKHRCRLWDNRVIRDLRSFLPTIASSVSFSSGESSLTPGQSLYSRQVRMMEEGQPGGVMDRGWTRTITVCQTLGASGSCRESCRALRRDSLDSSVVSGGMTHGLCESGKT